MSGAPRFIHLRTHTEHSLLEGAIPVKKLVKLAAGAAMPAIAVTDTNNMFCALEFSSHCKDAGLQPIVGCQVALEYDPAAPGEKLRLPAPIVLLAQSEAGYENLMKLNSCLYLGKAGQLVQVKFGISFTLTWLNQAGALVHVYQDGSVHLNHGGTEMGQGLNQKVAQVVAEVFGLEAGDIRITATDTGKVPNTSATAASSGSDLNGMASREAALVIRGRMAAFLAEKHQVAVEQVRFQGGMVRVAGEAWPFARVAAWAYQARISLSSTGYYATPKITWDRVKGSGRPFLYFAYGAAVSEVVIDTLTGENRILRADILHDTGSPLNPAIDLGQIEGAYVQGAGWLTTEELVWDGKGRLTTHAPSTYKIPACSDRPRIFNVDLWNRPNREETIGRSKAVGEPPFMLGISAWSALAHAVASAGDGSIWPDLIAPATPEAVLAAVERVRGHV